MNNNAHEPKKQQQQQLHSPPVPTWNESDLGHVSGELRIVEGNELREFGQIFLNDGRIVFEKEVMQVLGNEGGERGKGDSFVVEVERQKRGAKGIWFRDGEAKRIE